MVGPHCPDPGKPCSTVMRQGRKMHFEKINLQKTNCRLFFTERHMNLLFCLGHPYPMAILKLEFKFISTLLTTIFIKPLLCTRNTFEWGGVTKL